MTDFAKSFLFVVLLILLGFIGCKLTSCSRKQDTSAYSLTTALVSADSINCKPVVKMSSGALKSASNGIYKKASNDVTKYSAKKKVKSVDAVMIAERVVKDTVVLSIPAQTLYIDTAIYRPFAEYYIRTVRGSNLKDSLVIGSTSISCMHAVWTTERYDTHKTWIGRLLHKDKTMQKVTLTDDNPNIQLENSVFTNIVQ